MSIWYCVLGLALCVAGCGGKDMAQTPETSQPNNSPPSIRINDAAFVPTSGTVRVQWVQTNADAVTGYVLERKFGADRSFSSVIKTTASALTPTSTNVLSLQDTSVFAGEQIAYRVGAEMPGNKLYYSDVASVSVPGAKLESANLQRKNASVYLQWHADVAQALSYEVLRQADENLPEVVFIARDPTTTVFEDGPLQGNVRYSYQVRTVLRNGTRIVSRRDTTGLYLIEKQKQVISGQDTKMRLALTPSSSTSIQGPLICVFNGNGVDVNVLPVSSSDLAYIGSPFIPQKAPMLASSVSFTGYTLHAGPDVSKESFIIGIHPDTRAVMIHMYLIEGFSWNTWQLAPYTWESAPEAWQVDAKYQRTSVARDAKRLFVAAGGKLKVFSISNIRNDGEVRKAGLAVVGTIDIPGGSEPGDLVVTGTAVWLSLPEEHRLFRGQASFASDGTLQTFDWQDVSSPGVIADALTVSDNGNGNVLALDLRHRKIWMLNTNGQVLTYLNLPGSDLAEAWTDGDLIASVLGRFDALYVANGLGQVLLLRTE